ncbi:pilus assembly protein [Brachybacterium halotolerans subsp. kimchii]|uniref:TadE family type IV pilus minor pilin n=1 Tax=Brachybacterium halotolerans TaxID=2795215 RepID=UPI001E44A756|nr:TadE family type IV pilus minor pilin [Brachybacterium halotolerans]UEJ84118.1 pilus assembly protein [Brachybacterium halotolerans subsp. kimchii]
MTARSPAPPAQCAQADEASRQAPSRAGRGARRPRPGTCRPRPLRRALRGGTGSVTAETAIVLPVVVLMVLVILVAGVGIGAQVQLESAARGAARELARGQSEGEAVQSAQRIAGDGAQVSIGSDGAWVQVTVTRSVGARSGLLSGASWDLSGSAQARREPHLVGDGQGGGAP